MFTPLIYSLIGLVLALAILGNKSRELVRGKAFMKTSSSFTDTWCLAVACKARTVFEGIKVLSSRRAIVRSVVKFEQFLVKLFSRLVGRFTIVGDVIIGGSIPKNRGSVSFFLKNIEASKKQKTGSGDFTK